MKKQMKKKTSQNRVQNDFVNRDVITLGYILHNLTCVESDFEGLISHVAEGDILKLSRLTVLRQYASDLSYLTLCFREELKNNLLK